MGIHRKLFELWPFPSNHCRSLFSDIGLFSAHAAHAAHAAAATAAAAALHTLPCTAAAVVLTLPSKSFNIVPRRTKIALDPHDRRESQMNLEAKKSRMNLEVKSSTGCF